MRKLMVCMSLMGLLAAATAQADTIRFTWVPFNYGGPTNNGLCAPATCAPVGTLALTSAAIDSTWQALVGATSAAPGVRTIAGSAGNYTGTTAIQNAGLSEFTYSWNNAPNIATLALGSTLGNVQVGGAGWTAQFSSFVGAYILYNTVTFNGSGVAGQGLQVSDNTSTGSASMTNGSYSLFGLQNYGYWRLTEYEPSAPVPLPGAALLLFSGLLGGGMWMRRKTC